MISPERAKEIQESENWELMCKEIDNLIGMEVEKLKKCDKDELKSIQAGIKMLEKVKLLPGWIINSGD
jgi:hypothetical protein